MTLKPSKTPLLIAAIATALTLTSINAASAKEFWVSGTAQDAQVIQASDFAFKAYKFKSFKKHHGFKGKKKVVKPSVKKKLILKKKFF